MHLDQRVSLKNLNTMGIDAQARYFVEARKREDLFTLLHYRKMVFVPVRIMGGGSNILFTGDFNGLLVHVNTRGIEVVSEDERHVRLLVQAGEPWDDLVKFTVDKGWKGLEKLSLIPGTTGAAPIQNIGAYGAEVKESVESVEFVDIREGTSHMLRNEECRFGYRDSIFKHELKERIIITGVSFRLGKEDPATGGEPVESINYRDLREELAASGVMVAGVSRIRDAVVAIRRRKLPDPVVLGNAGSFFKNPVIPIVKGLELKQQYPEMPLFRESDDTMGKIPAAWLIEQCGWKGFREGDAGVHQHQPLVLVNYGKATGMDILRLSRKIRDSVSERFGISLEMEVSLIGDQA